MDLFEHQVLLPEEVRDILDKYNDLEPSYEVCENMQAELNELGYDFEWGLNAEPHDLKKIIPEYSIVANNQGLSIYKDGGKPVAQIIDKQAAFILEGAPKLLESLDLSNKLLRLFFGRLTSDKILGLAEMEGWANVIAEIEGENRELLHKIGNQPY